jgi:hypothetical protein
MGGGAFSVPPAPPEQGQSANRFAEKKMK